MSETSMTPRELLMIPMDDNDAGALTVGGYLQTLLTTLWREEEGFSSKRPFGNSGWAYDLYQPLIKAGVVAGGSLDSEGGVKDKGDADQIVFAAIEALFSEPAAIEEASRIAVLALHRAARQFGPAPEDT